MKQDKSDRKRFSVDVPIALHWKFKQQCVKEGVEMSTAIRLLIEMALKEKAK